MPVSALRSPRATIWIWTSCCEMPIWRCTALRATDGGPTGSSRPAWMRVPRRGESSNSNCQAIADDDLEVHYQPVVNLEDGKVSSCEALLRWRHPDRGMISPAEFVPIAEE